MGQATARMAVYANIEKERVMKINFMCKKCPFYIDKKCTEKRCVNEIRKGVRYSECSEDKIVRAKTSRIQS